MSDITPVPVRGQSENRQLPEELLPKIYDELRRMAASKMKNESPDHSLQATALVHEAWMRLMPTQRGATWESRSGFLSAAAEVMRRILVESARRRNALKRGGRHQKLPLQEDAFAKDAHAEEVISVNDALDALQQHDAQAAELVKLHYFAGLSLDEAGDLLDMSRATAYRTWTYARTFLKSVLSRE
ncbi:MAG: sigma-70 family RNA polymerase sigma factor [Planctomyces sp.]|nr:sigma-70 family RNA polymerase sigma factor [Planctomyces sp.]